MLVNVKEGAKVAKTKRALKNAFRTLLERQKFEKITVTAICEEALISRAAFYTNFLDKYDLLSYWLMTLKPDNIKGEYTYEQLESAVNGFISKNTRAIKNLVNDADNETLDILFEFIISALNLTARNSTEKSNPKYIIMSNIFAGGLLHYLLWQARNNFPPSIPPINRYTFKIIESFYRLRVE